MIFRFDEVSGNTDFTLLYEKVDFLKSKFECDIWLALSPLFHTLDSGRVYPEAFEIISDYTISFTVNNCKLHKLKREGIKIVSHGLFYVDHRLLSLDCQEMSIIAGRCLTNSKIFVPPFNKFNSDTEKICIDNLIHLVNIEHEWKNAEKEKFTDDRLKWYIKSWKWTLQEFKDWLTNEN